MMQASVKRQIDCIDFHGEDPACKLHHAES